MREPTDRELALAREMFEQSPDILGIARVFATHADEQRADERKACADIVSAAARGYEMTARIAGSVHFPGKPPTNAELLACCAGALKNAAHEIRSRSEE